MSMVLIKQLICDEGLRLKPYRDSAGKLTIGIGRNLDDKGISEGEACILAENDVEQAYVDILSHLPWMSKLDLLEFARFEVLVNMCFNMGIGGLLEFKSMLVFLQEENYEKAAQEMLDSKWAKQVGQRAVRLAEQMRTGIEVIPK